MATAGGAGTQIQNFVGKEVNGFEIQKLIGISYISMLDSFILGQGKFSYVFKA